MSSHRIRRARALPRPGTPLRQALELLYDAGRAYVIKRSRDPVPIQLLPDSTTGQCWLIVKSEKTRFALRPWCGLALDRPVSPTHVWRLTPSASERLSKARSLRESSS